MALDLYQVDAFTETPYAGNPAAVVFLERQRETDWMLAVAREMNLSETAFLLPEEDGYRLRWFTPIAEIELCGHATLASAHTLWDSRRLEKDRPASFYTLSGLLTATFNDGWVELDFPTRPVIPAEPPSGLESALGGISFVNVARWQDELLVEVADEEIVAGLKPDFARLRSIPIRGLIVTARASKGPFDIVSRFFAPNLGINEDPVTGAAHCCLAPYWSAKLGQTEFLFHQISARGGILRVRYAGERVFIAGKAVTVFSGHLLVD